MKQRGVTIKNWKQWLKDNRQRRQKCNKYFPMITVEEGKAKMKEIIAKIRKVGYYGV